MAGFDEFAAKLRAAGMKAPAEADAPWEVKATPFGLVPVAPPPAAAPLPPAPTKPKSLADQLAEIRTSGAPGAIGAPAASGPSGFGKTSDMIAEFRRKMGAPASGTTNSEAMFDAAHGKGGSPTEALFDAVHGKKGGKGGGGVDVSELEDVSAPSAAAPARPSGGGGGAAAPPKDPGPSDIEKWRVGPTVRAAYAKADEMAEDAIRGRTNDALESAEEQTAFYRDLAAKQQQRAVNMAKAERARAAVAQSYQEQYDRLAKDFASQKVDSKRLWNSMSTGDKIAKSIGVMLGSFVSGATGQRNDSLEQWLGEIKEEIDAQKANIDVKGRAVDSAKGAYGMMLQRFGDERAAEQATYAAYLEPIQTELKRFAAKAAGTEASNRAAEMIAKLEAEKASRLGQMTQYMLGAGGGGGGVASTGTPFQGKNAFNYGGSTFIAADEKDARDIREGSAALAELEAASKQIKALHEKVGLGDRLADKVGYETDDLAKLKQATTGLFFSAKRAAGSGMSSDTDAATLREQIGNVAGMGSSGLSAMDQYVASVKRQLANRVRSIDAEEVQKGFVPNKKGELERRQVHTGRTSADVPDPSSRPAGAPGRRPVGGQ